MCMPCPRNQAPGSVAALTWHLEVGDDGSVTGVAPTTERNADEVAVAINAGFEAPLWGLDWAGADS